MYRLILALSRAPLSPPPLTQVMRAAWAALGAEAGLKAGKAMVSPERRRWGGGGAEPPTPNLQASEGALRGLQDGEGGSLLELFCPPDLCQAVPGPFSL